MGSILSRWWASVLCIVLYGVLGGDAKESDMGESWDVGECLSSEVGGVSSSEEVDWVESESVRELSCRVS